MFLPRSQSELEVVAQTFNSSDKYWLAYQDILSDGCFVAVDGIYLFNILIYNYTYLLYVYLCMCMCFVRTF